MTGVLRVDQDEGLLTNVRMGAEIATGVAYLTGRRLSMPFEQPIAPAPRSSIAEADRGRPARLLDLFELPVEIVDADEWLELAVHDADVRDWGTIGKSVFVCDDSIDLDDPQLVDFANGRTRFHTIPVSEARVLTIKGRLLSFYSYLFFARPALRRQLHSILRGVRPRRPFVELGARIAADIGRFNAAHIRRSDLTIGLPAYDTVTPAAIAATLASVLATDEPLVVCSEVDREDELFDPIRRRFPSVVFANDLIIGENREAFLDLPRHEDNALGLVTQELASRAVRFVGTIGSTFTALIQRQQLLRDPSTSFRYTADYTPEGPRFCDGEFHEIKDGSYSWNRLGYSMSPDVLAWFREWPESA